MQFVRWEDLKIGMRLARPIYSKKGVLLFDRNSLLTSAAIESVRNFGLLGIYILEPAEPLPPMSEEDMEFERFQTVMVASIQEELEKINSTGRTKNIQSIAAQIIKKYGHNEGKINFYQNLRSKDDFVSRHALNVAILCAMITHIMNIPLEEQLQIIYAAITHDIGKMSTTKNINNAVFGDRSDANMTNKMYLDSLKGLDVVEGAFALDGTAIKRICNQVIRAQMEMEQNGSAGKLKLVNGAKILMVANRYDEKTAMTLDGESESEVKVIKEFIDHPEVYDEEVVSALIQSVNILFPGVSVELSTGEKALVIAENSFNILQPSVLCFKDNSILDLSLYVNRDIYVIDIMKTLDNRYIMSTTPNEILGGETNA